ncbi:MAG: winged helix-turn-helix domain-containing protein [Verrucomicrobiota bacterium]|nr:winged helix-turn-helix domain-containing protein [Verrucomicrobiota bacterium]
MKNMELIEMATAFTHQRRIAIVKSLDSGSKPLGQLSIATQIPPSSLYRHLAKLENRNVVLSERDFYCLALPENPLGKTLLEIATS